MQLLRWTILVAALLVPSITLAGYSAGDPNADIDEPGCIPPLDVDVSKLNTSEPTITDAETLQELLDQAQPGDIIKIGPCVIEGNFVTKNDGELDRPIILFSEGNTVLRPPAGGGGPIFLIQNSNYVLDGFEFDMAGRPGYAVQVFQTENVQLSNNSLHGARDCSGSGSAAGGVHIRGNSGKPVVGVRIRDNTIYENFAFGTGPSDSQVSECEAIDWADLSEDQCDALKDGPQQDANGIYMDHFVQCVDIRRNEIYNNGGDGIQCEATETAGQTSFGIVVADNRIYTDTPCSECGEACRGWTENAIDFKNCHQIRVTSTGDITAPGYPEQHFYGFYPSQASPHGDAMVLHRATSSVTIEKLRIDDSCRAVSAGTNDDEHYADPEGTVSELSLRRIFFETSSLVECQTPDISGAFHLGNVSNVDLNNLTIITDRTALVLNLLQDASAGNVESDRVDVWNNIVTWRENAGEAILLDPTRVHLRANYNVYQQGATFREVSGANYQLADWQNVPVSMDRNSTEYFGMPILGTRPHCPAKDLANTAFDAPAIEDLSSGRVSTDGAYEPGYVECSYP